MLPWRSAAARRAAASMVSSWPSRGIDVHAIACREPPPVGARAPAKIIAPAGIAHVTCVVARRN
jgi:hypothetical protein